MRVRYGYVARALLLSGLLMCTACSSDNKGIPEWPWGSTEEPEPEEPVEENPNIIALGWTNETEEFGTLPEHINVYKSPNDLVNKKSIAYIAVADMTKATFEVLGDVAYSEVANACGSATVKTPTEFYSEKKASVILNGGLFFWSQLSDGSGFYYSQSLMIRDGKLLSPNQNYYSEDWVTLWYPTIGAFCQMEDGTFQTTWTYYTGAGVNYCYPQPAENDITKEPLEVPSASFPEGAKELKAKNGIGGATVLLRNGEVVNTYVQEMLNIAATSNQPRSAVGVTGNNKMIFFVCEGRGVTDGVAGLTTADLSKVMKDLGCVEAINLDGGGSSCMLINGKETIQPSDGKQRAVLSGIALQ